MEPTTKKVNVAQMSHLELINHLGFRHVGKWRIGENGPDFEIEDLIKNKRQSLYAFVVGNEILYLGESTGLFSGRMRSYRRPGKSQSTNTRINPLIVEMIQSEKDISIYHFECVEEFKFRVISLNVASALEDTLIAQISPRWNMIGKITNNLIAKTH
jgi:hypothetical protein